MVEDERCRGSHKPKAVPVGTGRLSYGFPNHGHVAGQGEYDILPDVVVLEPGHMVELQDIPPQSIRVGGFDHADSQQAVVRVRTLSPRRGKPALVPVR